MPGSLNCDAMVRRPACGRRRGRTWCARVFACPRRAANPGAAIVNCLSATDGEVDHVIFSSCDAAPYSGVTRTGLRRVIDDSGPLSDARRLQNESRILTPENSEPSLKWAEPCQVRLRSRGERTYTRGCGSVMRMRRRGVPHGFAFWTVDAQDATVFSGNRSGSGAELIDKRRLPAQR